MFVEPKRLIAGAASFIMILPQFALSPQHIYAEDASAVTECGGWFEEAYAEWLKLILCCQPADLLFESFILRFQF